MVNTVISVWMQLIAPIVESGLKIIIMIYLILNLKQLYANQKKKSMN